MSSLQIAMLVLVFVGTFGAVLWLVARMGTDKTQRRVQQLLGSSLAQEGSTRKSWVDQIAQHTQRMAKLSVPDEGFQSSALRRRLVNAGIRNASAPNAYFGMKTVLALSLPALGFLFLAVTGSSPKGTPLLFVLLCLAALGYYLPNILLARAIARRQLEIFESFPDALDLMTVCMEAGLGTEAAMTRVADDMIHKSPVLSEELRLVNLELRAGAPRERAMRNLALRTGVEEVEEFVSMMLQAERFGTSLAQSLRVSSDTVRTRRRQKAEEAAAKVPLKLLFPLLFFIFPSLMLVIMGPAVIQMIRVVLPAMGGR